MTSTQKPLPKGWKWVKLGEMCKRVSDQILPTDSPDTEFTYIGLEHIESNTGNLCGINKENGNNIKSAKNKFRASDILYGKLRPYLNKVWLADRDGICSTDIWVLRPIKNIANDYFISTFLKSNPVVGLLSSKTEGANLPRVKASYFDKLPIPLPPLPTQHKIVEILEEADNLRKLRKQADEKMKNLIPSLFVRMFGDPVKNPKGWEVRKLGEVTNIRRGASPRPMGDPRYFGGAIPWIRISDIHRNGKFLNETEDHVSEEGAKRSVYLNAGSLIMAMAASIGTPCFLAVDGCIHDGFVVFEKLSPKLDKEFLYYFIIAFKDGFVSLAPEGTQKNLNTALIKSVTLPLPPLPLQQEFAKLVEDIEAEKARQAEGRKKLDELFNSLMQRAFTGELVA